MYVCVGVCSAKRAKNSMNHGEKPLFYVRQCYFVCCYEGIGLAMVGMVELLSTCKLGTACLTVLIQH